MTRDRSATESIKGYIYQFDRTALEILNSDDDNAEFTVEGLEDVDLRLKDITTLIQYKYYEGTTYNHSVLKPAICEMAKHFSKLDRIQRQKISYKIVGHYKDGVEKFDPSSGIDFLKDKFLTKTSKKVTIRLHFDEGLDNADLELFWSKLEINLNAPSFDGQRKELLNSIKNNIPGSSDLDVQSLYYPTAASVIQSLAIAKDIRNRRIVKRKFLERISTKEVLFNFWLRESLREDKYAISIKKKFFSSGVNGIFKKARIFIVEVPNSFPLERLAEVITKISEKMSHREHKRTPLSDRFCPFVLLRGITPEELAGLKRLLHAEGVKLHDGYAFLGAELSLQDLAADPIPGAMYKVKFISSESDLRGLMENISGVAKVIYEFYISSPIQRELIPQNCSYHAISIDEPSILNKIL
jgi:hypothetical protein